VDKYKGVASGGDFIGSFGNNKIRLLSLPIIIIIGETFLLTLWLSGLHDTR
jgi:hypothetical protein